jgi:hypothetical protein
MWRRQVGTISKKEQNMNIHNNGEPKKRKKGKNKKHLLTSMTSHIVDKKKGEGVEEVEEDDE